MKSKEFITEHVLNLFTVAEKSKYIHEVWPMLNKAYEKVGGFKSAANPDELVMKTDMWKLVTRDGKVTAVSMFKDSHGRKSIAACTDGTRQGLKDYNMLKNDDIKLQRSWAEVSGPPERILAKLGSTPIPAKFAQMLTGKEIVEINPDGVHYTRLIQGEPHEKIIYGFVKTTPGLLDIFKKHGISAQDLPPNFIKPS